VTFDDVTEASEAVVVAATLPGNLAPHATQLTELARQVSRPYDLLAPVLARAR
jgi:hypothetical protein